ncbi:MAG: ferredoxin family protein [Dehalococcoidales bacterium]|nr:ferredoxin family protein [Dehalococcoidales bacterium]
MKGNVKIDRELCKGCLVCIEFCPKKVIAPTNKVNAAGYVPVTPANMTDCTGCGTCALVCAEVAIEVYRE